MKGGIEKVESEQQVLSEDSEEVDASKIKPISGGKFNLGDGDLDLKSHDKMPVKIEGSEIKKVHSKFVEQDTDGKIKHQWILRIFSVPVMTLQGADGNVDFRASDLFNLVQNMDESSPNFGKLEGFPTGDRSNLAKFLKDLGVKIEELEDLSKLQEAIIGKTAVIKAYDKEKDGKTMTYLKFRY